MTKIGRYEILEELGRGGFATVYKARDTQLKRLVALKVLHAGWSGDPDFVRRFQQEAEVSAGFSHPNIVTVYDVGEIERQLFIAMEFLSGQNLQQWLGGKGRPLSVSETLTILEPLGDALDYAHQKGVVHRDIKPGNVMILETDGKLRVVLTDFGLVKAMENSMAVTKTGQTLGSPEYMAPEQADPNRQDEVGSQTDLYAFGIIAYQMLTGRVPFPGNSISTLYAHANLDVPSPGEINPDLADGVTVVLMQLLAKDPAERYKTAKAFIVDLQQSIQAEEHAKALDAQVVPLYTRLEQARDEGDWVTMLSLATQIEMIFPGYRDVAELQTEAQQHLRSPQADRSSSDDDEKFAVDGSDSESLVEVSLSDSDPEPQPIMAEITSSIDTPGTTNDIVAPPGARTLPKYVWIVGGLVGIALVAFVLLSLPSLLNGSENANNNDDTSQPAGGSETDIAAVFDSDGTPTVEAVFNQQEDQENDTETIAQSSDEPQATVTVPTLPPSPTSTTVPTPTPTLDPSVPPLDPTLGTTWTRLSDNMVMVYVPAGSFFMGSDLEKDPDADPDEFPLHEVSLDGFWLDQTEVTNAQYALCVQDGACEVSNFYDETSLNGDNQPVVGVTWFDAEAYCTWAGVQLPTEAQWEYAARGDDGRLYTWGDDTPSCDLVQYGICGEATEMVGSFSPAGDSWVGAMDMLGNVWEWVADWYGSNYYEISPETNPTGPEEGSNKVLRGGGWRISISSLRTTNRGSHGAPEGSDVDVGFRCAMPGS